MPRVPHRPPTAATPTSRSWPPRVCRSRSPRPARSSRRRPCAPPWAAGGSSSSRTPTVSPPTPTRPPTLAQGAGGADAPHGLDALAASLEDVIVTIRSRSQPRAPAHSRRSRPSPSCSSAATASTPPCPVCRPRRPVARRPRAPAGPRRAGPHPPPRPTSIAMATKILGIGDAIGAARRPRADRRRGVHRLQRRARRRRAGPPHGDPGRRPDGPHPATPHPLAGRRARARAEPAPPARPATWVDRALVDLTSIYRDALVCACARTSTSSTPTPSTGCERSPGVSVPSSCSARWMPSTRPGTASNANVPPLLALEAMALQLRVAARPRRVTRHAGGGGVPPGHAAYGSPAVTTRARGGFGQVDRLPFPA